jgi:hypothetical protein
MFGKAWQFSWHVWPFVRAHFPCLASCAKYVWTCLASMFGLPHFESLGDVHTKIDQNGGENKKYFQNLFHKFQHFCDISKMTDIFRGVRRMVKLAILGNIFKKNTSFWGSGWNWPQILKTLNKFPFNF